MNAIEQIDLSIEFVKSQVDPGGGGGNAAAQTGDFYFWAILAIFFVGIIAYCMFEISRLCNYKNQFSASHAKVSSNSFAKPGILFSSVLMILAVVGLIISVVTTTSKALANTNNGIDFKPDKIQVVIDEETGEATCDPFEFVNNTTSTYIFEKSELILSEDAKLVSVEDDWDLTLHAIGLNSYLFDGQPGQYDIDLTNIKPFNPDTTSAATLTFNKIDASIASKLIGKKVFTLTLTPYKNVVEIPKVAEGLIFDNTQRTGVEPGEGYTLTGTPKATDAGTYDVTASLEKGMIWADKTIADKKMQWTISPFNVVLEFDVGPEGYSVHYGDDWPASAEVVKIISKQTLPEDFSEIFKDGISINHSYSPGQSQAGSVITVSILKPTTNTNYTTTYSDTAILNVLKRALTITWDEDTCTVTWDGEEHWPEYETTGAYQEEKPLIDLAAKNLSTGQPDTPINIGQYEITASLADRPINNNYQLTSDSEHPLTCTLTINEKPAASSYWKVEGTTLSLSPTELQGFTKDEDILKGFSSPEDAPWHESLDSIKKVEILEGESNTKITPSKMTYLFAGLTKLESIEGLSYIETSAVKDMSCLFQNDQSLTNLDLSYFSTSQATNMSALFQDTYKLESITLSSNFTTSLNTNFSSMFSDCGSQSSSGVTISNFKDSIKTTNAEDMSNMFFHANFATVDLTGFSTSKVTNFSGMFQDFKIQDSKELDLSSFSNASATNLELMFADCEELTTIYANPATWGRSKTCSGDNTFRGCNSLVGTNKDESYSLAHGQDTTYDSAAYAYICESEALPGLMTPTDAEFAYWGLSVDNTILYISPTLSENATNPNADILTGFNLGGSPWYAYRESIKKVIVEQGRAGEKLTPISTKSLLSYLTETTEIQGLNNINTSFTLDMTDMFASCYKLNKLDVTGFDTSRVKSMQGMFQNCLDISTLDLSNFKTDEVTDMGSMFHYCLNLNNLNISNFNTEIVEFMDSMFSGCSNLEHLDLLSFSNNSLVNNSSMFMSCSRLAYISADPLKWVSKSYFLSNNTFYGCTLLVGTSPDGLHHTAYADNPDEHKEGKYARVDTAESPGLFSLRPIYAYWGLSADNSILYISPTLSENATNPNADILTGFNLRGSPWYAYSESIKKVIVEQGRAGEKLTPISTKSLLSYLTETTEIQGLNNINTSFTLDMTDMFAFCNKLNKLDVTGFDTSRVKSMQGMFQYCQDISTLDLSNFKTDEVIDMGSMFYYCLNLNNLNISNFNTKIVEFMDSMFSGCSNLEHLDLLSFSNNSLVSNSNMFMLCSRLAYISADPLKWVSKSYLLSSNTFYGCTKLVGTSEYGLHHTAYADNPEEYKDGSYARVDVDDNNRGLFSSENTEEAKAFWGYNDNTKTLYIGSSYSDKTPKPDNKILDGFSSSTKVPWSLYSSEITNVEILPGENGKKLEFTNMQNLFAKLINCTTISGFNTETINFENLESMKNTFSDSGFTNLDLSAADTSHVTNMWEIFSGCTKLENVNLTGDFNTGAVTILSEAFEEVGSETDTGVEILFGDKCTTSNVSSMIAMFEEAKFKDGTLDISTFTNSKNPEISEMFESCENLKTIYADPNKWTRDHQFPISSVFENCKLLVGTSKSGYQTVHGSGSTYDYSEYAYICESKSMPGLFTPLPEPTAYWGLRDNNTTLYLCATPTANANTEDPNILKGYSGGKKTPWNNALETISQVIVEPGDHGKQLMPIDTSLLFCGLINCLKISGLNNINTENVVDMTGMFANCKIVAYLDLSSFDTSRVEFMDDMFYNCVELSSVDFSNASNTSIKTVQNTFLDCKNLTTVYIDPNKWATDKARSFLGNSCFLGCEKLVGYSTNIKHYTSYIDNPDEYKKGWYACVDKDGNNRGLFTDYTAKAYYGLSSDNSTLYLSPNWSTNAKTSWPYILNGGNSLPWTDCASSIIHVVIEKGRWDGECLIPRKTEMLFYNLNNCLEITGLKNINTENVGDMSYMFAGCSKLTYLDLSSFDTLKVEYMDEMFSMCHDLSSVDFSNASNTSILTVGNMFYNCKNLTTVYIDPNKWATDKARSFLGNACFSDCEKLVGYSTNLIHKTSYIDNPDEYRKGVYACVDVDDNNRGLFTDISMKPTQNSAKLTVENPAENDAKDVINLGDGEEQHLPEPETPANNNDESKNDKAIINKDDENKEAVVIEDDDDEDGK